MVKLTEWPGRAVQDAYMDGDTIVALVSNDVGAGSESQSVVRSDLNGTILQETPTDFQSMGGYDVAFAGSRRLFLTMTFTDRLQCGFREVNPDTLTLGPILEIRADDTCGGPWMVDAAQPAIIWVLQRDLRRLARVDTAAGAVSFVPLDPSMPAGSEASAFEVFNSNVYLELVRPDQTRQLVLVDQTTGTPVATTEIAGSLGQLPGQLVAHVDELRTQLIDPATLVITEAATEDVFTLESQPGPLWTVNLTEDHGQLHVTQYDGTFQVVGVGGTETGFKPSDFVHTEWLGTDDVLYILASRQDADMWLDNRSLTQLHQLVPAN